MRIKNYILSLSILAVAAMTVAADVKIKTKQSVAGQSMESTTYIKGKRSRTESMGGTVSLTQCDLRRSVQLNTALRTYMISEFEDAVPSTAKDASPTRTGGTVPQTGGRVTTTITVKDTGERKQMFGFTAKHLIITMETVSSPDACSPNNSKMQMDGWYVDAEFALDCDYGFRGGSFNPYAKKGCQDKYEVKQVGTTKRGYPLYEKMTMFGPDGSEQFSSVSEVVELSRATLEPALFEIPGDYRQVTDSSELYAASSAASMMPQSGASSSSRSTMPLPSASEASAPAAAPVGAKQPGTVRIGLANVKTGAVGEGLNAADLASAVANSLAEYLKSPGIEVVQLEAKLPSAIDAEARQKECDQVIYATVSHKKGGGGFGMFGSAIGSAVGRVGIGHTGSTAGNIAGQVATQTIVSAASVSANVKNKDQITLEVRLQQPGGQTVLTRQFTAKAKSDGDDIISQVVEAAAQSVVDASAKR
ncbi:MAG: hypothetical protein ACK4S4_13835 [Pyrinomonadaceae bacterium]